MDKNAKVRHSGIQVLARKATFHVRQLTITVILLVLMALLYACVVTPVPDSTVTPESDSTITPDPTTLPGEALKCDTGDSGEYICNGLSGHTITVTNVPENVSPYLLPVSPEEEEKLLQLPREDIGCIISIVGNLAFYDADNILVTSFPSAVSLTYPFTDEDNSKFDECAQSLQDQGIVASPSEVTYVPIYLYNKPDMVIWKSFQNPTFGDGTVTINFTEWGDQQEGFGTRP